MQLTPERRVMYMMVFQSVTDFVCVLEELGQRVGPQAVGVLQQQLLQFQLQVGAEGSRGGGRAGG